jgi:chaperonin GroEL (HSP60 family)
LAIAAKAMLEDIVILTGGQVISEDREKLQEWLAKLAGGVAVTRVGGSTDRGRGTRRIASTTRCTRTRAASRRVAARPWSMRRRRSMG